MLIENAIFLKKSMPGRDAMRPHTCQRARPDLSNAELIR
jgi:hypothetical protein